MEYRQNFYRTHDGSQYIEFLFVHISETQGWRAYVLTDINYQTRYSGCATVHYLIESNADIANKIRNFMRNTRSGIISDEKIIKYICWNQPIYTIENIMTVAKSWSEITAYYIKNGGDFGSIQKLLKRRGVIDF